VSPTCALTGFVSIHDVMPEVLEEVQRLVAWLRQRSVAPITLLIVPGRSWQSHQLDLLRDLLADGAVLAGHGWLHTAVSTRTIGHRLHAATLSRDVAEHLSRTPEQVVALIRCCAAWFPASRLPSPELYVPPAWAMGVPDRLLSDHGFRWFERLGSVYDSRRRRRCWLPLIGFETDTQLRAMVVRCWNRLDLSVASTARRTVRIALHPHDLQLRLAGQIEPALRRCARFVDVRHAVEW